jgi:hypothetical protein
MRLLRRTITLLSLAAALSVGLTGSAFAATAIVTPNGTAAGTGTTPWQLTIDSSSGPVQFNCVNAGFTATFTSTSGALPLTIATAYQQTFSNCRTGTVSYNVSCNPTATTLSATALTTSSGTTALTLDGLNCIASIGGCGSARISGTLPTTFDNLTTTLTVTVAGQAVRVTGSTCSLIPNGNARFTAPGGGPFTYRVSPATTVNVF